ncbi:hypothetical protein EC973_001973 [Apophysomyces ossiformis]|uniref:Uncharacterized protein n=1 Tax=Apophysomyces ossiformis TaxID=679940 RepID=A0A8H7ES50_9FUNG|nr:hypothetical protein EC973_001973 [Apophysomyces ossiformis]
MDGRVSHPTILSDPNTIQYEAYNCPLCQDDLTHIHSAVLRQRHVDQCLDSAHPAEENLLADDTYEYCIFCGKDISTYNGSRKESHFSRCMDEMAAEARQLKEQERQQKLSTFAGQQIPFLSQLDVCPCCYDTFSSSSLRQKVAHIKQCSKRRNITMEQLLNTFRWIQYGHQLTPRQTDTTGISPSITISQGSIHATAVDEDNDFSSDVIFHRRSTANNRTTNRNDENDEELHLVLALSKSMHGSKESKKRRHLDGNVANILTIEESRKLVEQELEHLLYQSNDECKTSSEQYTHVIPLSRIQNDCAFRNGKRRPSLWTLAAADETVENRMFCADFMKIVVASTGHDERI